VPERVAELAEIGAQPVFSLGARGASGPPARDPQFPDLPGFAEFRLGAGAGPVAGSPFGPLLDALGAVAAAGQMEFGLVLPRLTPAAVVALWRHAGAIAAQTPEMQTAAAALAVRVSADADAVAPLAPGAQAMLELRRWLAKRYDWRPS
jgi:hypothetical protein